MEAHREEPLKKILSIGQVLMGSSDPSETQVSDHLKASPLKSEKKLEASVVFQHIRRIHL